MICILTDSTCDLPQQICEKYNIHVIPIHVFYDNKTFLDGVTIGNDQFYSILNTTKDKFPYTEPPTVEDFISVYEKLSVDYDQIISIHVSSKVSLTCENAREAVVRGRQKYFFNCYRTKRNFNTFAIHVVDSQSVSIGNGLLSIKAAQWVEEGLEAEEIVDRLRGLASKVSVFVAPKNLSFLRRSKRVGALKFLIGNLLGISPVLCFQNGTMDLHNSVRGVDRAVNLIVEKTKTDVDIPSCPLIGIARSGNLADASIRKFTRDLQISDNENDQFVSQIGATITSHTGPESLAVAFVRK